MGNSKRPMIWEAQTFCSQEGGPCTVVVCVCLVPLLPQIESNQTTAPMLAQGDVQKYSRNIVAKRGYMRTYVASPAVFNLGHLFRSAWNQLSLFRCCFMALCTQMFQFRKDRVAWSMLWCILAAVGCNSGTEYVTFEGLAMPLQPQASVEREWQQVSLRQLYVVPRESGIKIYRRGLFTIGPDGALYFMDPGDMKIKHFDADGYFMQSYGRLGEGPGEFSFFTDAAILGDSVLYVNDPYRRIVSFFAVDSSTFLYTIPNIHAFRYRITQGGRAYWLTMEGDSLLGTSLGKYDVRFIGTMIQGQTVAHRMLMGGYIVPYQEDIVHVSSRYPILVRYDSIGTVIYARATPDFEKAEPPGLERLNTSSGFSTRVRGRSLNGYSEIYGDKLVVYAFMSASEKAFDVYDAATGNYEYSVSMPWGSISYASYDPIRKRIWQVRDTTIAVYAVDHPGMALGNVRSHDSEPEPLPPR